MSDHDDVERVITMAWRTHFTWQKAGGVLLLTTPALLHLAWSGWRSVAGGQDRHDAAATLHDIRHLVELADREIVGSASARVAKTVRFWPESKVARFVSGCGILSGYRDVFGRPTC